MKELVVTIPLPNLLYMLMPIAIVIYIFYRWSLKYVYAMYVSARMIVQLLIIGYILAFIFKTEYQSVVILVLTVMLIAASWISVRTSKKKKKDILFISFISLVVGGITTLLLVTQLVLEIEPWYNPRFIIPLGGMIFAAIMNSISLALDRFESELDNGKSYKEARGIAFKAAMIPKENSFLAVGLVSLPGIMTGQVLSGVEPIIAARYQIMVMCMIYGSSGIATAILLILHKNVSN